MPPLPGSGQFPKRKSESALLSSLTDQTLFLRAGDAGKTPTIKARQRQSSLKWTSQGDLSLDVLDGGLQRGDDLSIKTMYCFTDFHVSLAQGLW